MAFDNLTQDQARILIETIETLASGRFRTEFVVAYFIERGGVICLYGKDGASNHEIIGFSETDIVALKEEGYLTVTARGKASLKPKALKEYEHHSKPQQKPMTISRDTHVRRLVKVFIAAGGSEGKLVLLSEIFNDEGLSEQDAWNEADFMKGEGWVDILGDNGPPCVYLTHHGIKAAESYMSSSNQSHNIESSKESSKSTSSGLLPIDIFISHSSEDTKIAEALIDLLKAALNLSADVIRCTSVNGYKLPPGADVNEQLRREIYDAKVFIGIITPTGLKSTYVLFELGARWGAKRPLLPVLSSADNSILKEPLKTLNAGCLYSTADVHELIAEVARQLNVSTDRVAAYEKYIATLVRRAKPKTDRKPKSTNDEAKPERDEDVDMRMYAQLCKALDEAKGNTYEVEPGSSQHLWAERMVQKGLLKRMVSGHYYSLPDCKI